jgi:hypothetical protein
MENSNVQKRVYFLGAGASKASDFTLPTMNEFFREEDFKNGNYDNLHAFTKKVFPNANISELNLEDVITCLELSVDKFGVFGEHPESYLYEARREFSLYVRERLTYPPIKEEDRQERYWCRNHKVLFKQLTDHDSIITLNYDLIIEHTLFEISRNCEGGLLRRSYNILGRTLYVDSGDRPSLYHTDVRLGHYLKLHGSINWIYCANPTCGNHQLLFPNWIGSKGTQNSLGDPCILCGSPLVSVIIPPTMNKTFDEYPKLGLSWSLAFREIRDADELVLIGMSLPDSDYYLKWLVNSAVSSREDKHLKVVVVNIDKGVCDKVEKLTGARPEYHDDFREYVENLKIE